MNITDILVEQCRKPDGLLGRTMLKIMNVADVGMTDWAVSQMGNSSGQMLDIGCGSGKTVSVLSKTYPKSKIFGIDYSEAQQTPGCLVLLETGFRWCSASAR